MIFNRPAKTFYIFYAWAEGPWHGKNLYNALKVAGFTEAPSADATILIAHSVGSYLVKPSNNNKITLLIGPPYWPGKPTIFRLIQKVWHDRDGLSLSFWIEKIIWNTIYILTKPTMNIKAWRSLRLANPLSHVGQDAIVIRNENDFFCSPDLKKLIKRKVISLPGQHDDCWINPGPYIKLLQSEYIKLKS
jgi:hypothetical protein